MVRKFQARDDEIPCVRLSLKVVGPNQRQWLPIKENIRKYRNCICNPDDSTQNLGQMFKACAKACRI
eukprot:4340095-Amphidinium_carterae.1